MEYLQQSNWLNKYSFIRDLMHEEFSIVKDYNKFIRYAGCVYEKTYGDKKLRLDNCIVDANVGSSLLMKVK